MRAQALASALTAQAEHCFLLELGQAANLKTARKTLTGFQVNDEQILVILPETNIEIMRVIRNMANLHVMTASQVTALDIVHAHTIILTAESVAKLEARVLAKSLKSVAKPVTAAKSSKIVKPVKTVPAKKAVAVKSVKTAKSVTKPKAVKVTKPKIT